MVTPQTIEYFANQIHNVWMNWSQAVSGSVSKTRLERWQKLWVPFWDLPPQEKESDRKIAKELLDFIYPVLRKQIKAECWYCDAPLGVDAQGGLCSMTCRKKFFKWLFADEIKALIEGKTWPLKKDRKIRVDFYATGKGKPKRTSFWARR